VRGSCPQRGMSWDLTVIPVQAVPSPVDAVLLSLVTVGRDRGCNKVHQPPLRQKARNQDQGPPRDSCQELKERELETGPETRLQHTTRGPSTAASSLGQG